MSNRPRNRNSWSTSTSTPSKVQDITGLFGKADEELVTDDALEEDLAKDKAAQGRAAMSAGICSRCTLTGTRFGGRPERTCFIRELRTATGAGFMRLFPDLALSQSGQPTRTMTERRS